MGDEERTAKTWRESLGDGQLEGDRWYHVLFKGLFPGSLYLLAIGVIGAIYGSDMVGEWTNLTFLFLVPPMGTGALVPLGMSKGFSPLTMALTVTLVDAIMAMYVVWWLVLLKKIPGLGKAFNWIEEKAGKKVESDPRMKRGSWMVIYMSLLIPVQGSGGINMAVIGRVLGLRADSIVSAIVAGSFSIAVITAFMASVGMSLLQESLVGFIIFIMLMVQALVITILLKNRYQMRKWEAELARTP
ncbi:MAG: small multi-drug export protein [Thermoplasmata archaeon]|nr:MAG: small multi-drug export protein [Thermoplasmata archaeon]